MIKRIFIPEVIEFCNFYQKSSKNEKENLFKKCFSFFKKKTKKKEKIDNFCFGDKISEKNRNSRMVANREQFLLQI